MKALFYPNIFSRLPKILAAAVLLFLPTMILPADDFPSYDWENAAPSEMKMNEQVLLQARDYAMTGQGSGCVIVQGKQVLVWGNTDTLYDLKSSSKSIGVTLLGIALKDGLVDWDDPAVRHHPEFAVMPEKNRETGWIPQITLRMLANQTAGFDKSGGYVPLLFEPGTMWSYSDSSPNWLAECLTLVFQRDLNDVIFERVFTPIGITPKDIIWRKHAYRPEKIHSIVSREFGSGFRADIRAMSRIGYLYLKNGIWNNKDILPESFLSEIHNTAAKLKNLPVFKPNGKDEYGNASQHYSTLWWNNADGTIPEVPRDAYWAWGLHDSLIFIVPSLDLVAVRAGNGWKRKPDMNHYDVLKPFFVPLVSAGKTEIISK